MGNERNVNICEGEEVRAASGIVGGGSTPRPQRATATTTTSRRGAPAGGHSGQPIIDSSWNPPPPLAGAAPRKHRPPLGAAVAAVVSCLGSSSCCCCSRCCSSHACSGSCWHLILVFLLLGNTHFLHPHIFVGVISSFLCLLLLLWNCRCCCFTSPCLILCIFLLPALFVSRLQVGRLCCHCGRYRYRFVNYLGI